MTSGLWYLLLLGSLVIMGFPLSNMMVINLVYIRGNLRDEVLCWEVMILILYVIWLEGTSRFFKIRRGP